MGLKPKARATQLVLFPDDSVEQEASDTTSTFVDNMKLPVHRWFRYSAGFSAEWVKEVVNRTRRGPATTLLDPFCGSGTTPLAGEECGVYSIGIEAHPFIARVARCKLLWHEETRRFSALANAVLSRARRDGGVVEGYQSLIYKCFPDSVLRDLDALRRAWLDLADGSPSAELTWLALTSILRSCSPVGTAQMELIQPKKQKVNSMHPFEAFAAQVDLMLQDMRFLQRTVSHDAGAIVYEDDARVCRSVDTASVTVVITSPPYVNNYDYADATRLEMTFWGEVGGWGDLHDKVRRHLLPSCSQHMSYVGQSMEQLLDDRGLLPIIGEVRPVCERLAEVRLAHGGKKNYHLMVAAYFSDMARVWAALRRVCIAGSRVCFVVGDSAPYGVYVPVYDWLGRLAVASGFESAVFERTRDRNVKWKNRKHRVPLCEGRLWVSG